MNYLNLDTQKVEPVVNELNILLADYHIYYQNLRTFHWNILGKNFFDLHMKFENLYIDAREKIDEIAERILTLRYHPLSKSSNYLDVSTIDEVEIEVDDAKMVSTILTNHKALLAQMSSVFEAAQQAKDEGTSDMIGAYIGGLEKESWMLNAWSQDTTAKLNKSSIPSKK
ncbi:MAG: DNA starvation/stationary phase protection protein [Dokdonia sp.]|nr:DNA starvation/stationary phase protection protein [Cytophagaceae bacterium]